MNDRTAGAVLLVIGVVAIFAAIVGGGIKIQQIEVGSVQSKWRQWLLGAFGLVIGLVGLIMVLPDDKPADAAQNVEAVEETTPSADENAAPADENGTAADENAAEPAADGNAEALPADENADAGQDQQAQ